jgi:hypothetical protein
MGQLGASPGSEMAKSMNRPPTVLWLIFLRTVAEGAPNRVSSDAFKVAPIGWTTARLRGVHSSLHQWASANCQFVPWQHGDGASSVTAWYQMTTDAASVVLGIAATD